MYIVKILKEGSALLTTHEYENKETALALIRAAIELEEAEFISFTKTPKNQD